METPTPQRLCIGQPFLVPETPRPCRQMITNFTTMKDLDRFAMPSFVNSTTNDEFRINRGVRRHTYASPRYEDALARFRSGEVLERLKRERNNGADGEQNDVRKRMREISDHATTTNEVNVGDKQQAGTNMNVTFGRLPPQRRKSGFARSA